MTQDNSQQTAELKMLEKLLRNKQEKISPSFHKKIATQVEQSFKGQFVSDALSNSERVQNTLVKRVLQKEKITAQSSFASTLKSRVLNEFQSVQTHQEVLQKTSFTQKITDFFRPYTQLFKVGFVPALAIMAVFALLPSKSSPVEFSGPENFELIGAFPETVVPKYAGLLEEKEEDVVFFAMLDAFDSSLDDMHTMESLHLAAPEILPEDPS